jgi:hypothetical protein
MERDFWRRDDRIMDEDKYKSMLEKAKLSKEKSFNKQLNKRSVSHQNQVSKALQTIRISNRHGSYINHFRGAPGAESDKHLDMKYKVWKELRRRKHDCIVEAIFESGGRCDILDLNTMCCIEVLCSETKEMCDKKEGYYPKMFDIIRIDANKEFNQGDLL